MTAFLTSPIPLWAYLLVSLGLMAMGLGNLRRAHRAERALRQELTDSVVTMIMHDALGQALAKGDARGAFNILREHVHARADVIRKRRAARAEP